MHRVVRFTIPIFLVLTLTLVACTSEGSEAEPSPSPSAPAVSPTPPAPSPTPGPGGLTGIGVVDVAIAAIEAGDVDALAAAAVFETLECTTAQGAGGPPKCEAGEADGSRVEVLAAASCEGYYLRRAELKPTLARFLEGALRLEGVYEHSGRIFLPGEYVVIYTYTDDALPGPVARQLFLSDEGVVGLNFGCGQSPAELVDLQELTTPIFEIREQAPAPCPVAFEVCATAEEAEAAVESVDFGALVADAALSEYECPAGPPQGLGGPFPLCDGAAAGEERSGMRLAYLESEGAVVDSDGLSEALERWARGETAPGGDAFGSGASRLFSVGCPAETEACGDRFALVFSQLQPAMPYRIQMVLYFEEQQGEPRLVFVAFGPLLLTERLEAALTGGDAEFVTPEGWPASLTFHLLGR